MSFRSPNMNCLRTVPKHLLDLREKAAIQVLLRAHTNPEILPDPQCPKVSCDFVHSYLKNGPASTDNCYGTFDSNNLHLQPFSRFSPLLNFTQELLLVKTLSPTPKSGGTNFIRSARSRRISSRCWISRCVCTASFSISSFKRACLVHVDVSFSGFMEAGSSELPVCFRSDLCQSGLVHFFEAISTSAERNFLNNRTPISARSGQGVYGPFGSVSLYCAFDGKPACHEDGGKPCLHKSISDSSGTCPSTREALKITSDGDVLWHWQTVKCDVAPS